MLMKFNTVRQKVSTNDGKINHRVRSQTFEKTNISPVYRQHLIRRKYSSRTCNMKSTEICREKKSTEVPENVVSIIQ